MSSTAATSPPPLTPRPRFGDRSYGRRSSYLLFVLPALVVIVAVIIFPWIYTVFMSFHDWQVGARRIWVGLDNYGELLNDLRFRAAVGRTFVYTVLAVALPVGLGTIAAILFHQEFPFRGLFRGIFILPMIATPVAIALVWTMMYHPQLGVLNYLLSLVGLPPSLWVYAPDTVIPSLVLVETWQWTPLVMLIVLGGLASLPVEPLESAVVDGAGTWRIYRDIILPMTLPFLMVAVVLRTIDSLKAFDTIFAITQGGPGTASETINIYLYLQAFSFFRIGHASAVVVVFFVIVVACSLALLIVRQRTKWS
ncbi:MAG: sugar ABC transporter permease [Chloroflexia bacterium]|nr:sugar ABC transporter permease [Chloroflexia bacterium]MDQ3412641.1 sugar ABC transporter permease [Chloroflexota bacterium]